MRWSQSLILGAIGAVAFSPALTAGRTKPQGAQVSSVTAATTVALRPFTGDPNVARQGRVLFLKNNCYGCHGGLAGGGMGPSLRDTVWRYGDTDAKIYDSIHDGRPMGMPTWGTTLTRDQINTLVVYIKSLRTDAEPNFFWGDGAETTPGQR
jgi:cbb3-type cytochrome c oxidase subunit III